MDEVITFQFLSNDQNIEIERFHICTWDVDSFKPIIEFGVDISNASIGNLDEIEFTLFTPWPIKSQSDLFDELKKVENARFIFNESISSTDNLNDNPEFGVVHKFSNDTKLCLLPIEIQSDSYKVHVKVNLTHYKPVK